MITWRYRLLLPALVAVLLTLPRSAATYPLYLLASLLLVDLGRLRRATLVVLVGGLVWFALAFYLQGPGVSVTALGLEVALVLPTLLFLAGAPVRLTAAQATQVVRLLNVLVAGFSFYHLLTLGFPLRLPYRDYLPDEYFGAYGVGGAQLVTLIGFFGLVAEQLSDRPGRAARLLALINFLLPSYIVGIVAGVAGLSLLVRRRPLLLAAGVLVIALPLAYALLRLDLVNTTLASEFGAHPKRLAFDTVLALYREQPATLLRGAGLGQFSSVPALWGSALLPSGHGVPTLPGLFASDYHYDYLGALLAVNVQDAFALSSSLNKPYNSYSTLLAEWGLVATLGFLVLLGRRFYQLRARLGPYSAVLFVTVMILYGGELWHDDLWLGFLLLGATGFRRAGHSPPAATARFAPVAPGLAGGSADRIGQKPPGGPTL